MSAQAIHTVAIIGAKGTMGRLFTNLCREAGQEVVELDQPLEGPGLKAGLRLADLVLLAVPIPVMDRVLATVVPLLSGSQILSDVCSVKQEPMEHMLAAYAGPVVGTHPLFGQPQQHREFVRVTVCPGRDQAAHAAVMRWTKNLGLEPFAATAEEHDRAMAFIQGLNFVTSAAYLSVTSELDNIRQYVTPSFKRRLDAAQKMLTQDGDMFEAIFEANPHSQEAVRRFRAHLNLAAGGDINLLTELACWWFRQPDQPGQPTREEAGTREN